MNNFQVHPELLGSWLTNSRGDKHRIMAIWTEDTPGAFRLITVLTVRQDGAFFKVNLPDPDWELCSNTS